MINSMSTLGVDSFSANRPVCVPGPGAATPATSPLANMPATSTAPIETYQRIAALPSCHVMVTRKSGGEKRRYHLSFTFKLEACKLETCKLDACRLDMTC